MGLNVQIVEPVPDYRPCQSPDNGTTLVRARLIATVGIAFESDNYMIMTSRCSRTLTNVTTFKPFHSALNRVYGLETDTQGPKMGQNLNAMPVTARNHL